MNKGSASLSNVTLICFHLSEISGALFPVNETTPDARNESQAMEKQGISNMPMAEMSSVRGQTAETVISLWVRISCLIYVEPKRCRLFDMSHAKVAHDLWRNVM